MDSAGNIVFVATCNNYAVLPETLTRPGRLDKKIGIGAPAYSSRVEILKMYAQKSSCRFEMTMEDMAKLCVGFSCAALETLVNECILQSDEEGIVSESLIRERFFEIKNEDIPRERSTVDDTVRACQNVGAFIVAKTFNSGHYVLNLEFDTACNDFFNAILSEYDSDYEEDDYDDDEDDENENTSSCVYYTKADLMNTITVLLGGYVAEELILHKVYDNGSAYLSIVDSILFSMSEHGMFGLDLRYSEDRHEKLPYLSDKLERLNKVFDETIQECYGQAKAILLKNETLIKKLIPCLVEKQILQAEECEKLLAEWGGIQK